MARILCVGEMVIDFLPGAEKDSYIRKAGGAPANVAVAAARQGCSAGFCGMVGDDDFGHFLMDTLKANGVEQCVGEMTREATTTMTFVTLDADGDRSFTFARKPGADMLLTRAHIRPELLCAADAVHAGSCSLSRDPAADATAFALREAHRLGKLVSFDVNYRDLMWGGDVNAAASSVREILPCVDFLKISEEEADMFGGEAQLPALMLENNITLLIETLGSRGALCHWNGETLHVEARKANCVDTCGAGDAFWGSFLSTLLLGGVRSPKELTREKLLNAMQRGNVAGWLCVQKKGAIESLPTAQEIEHYTKELYG